MKKGLLKKIVAIATVTMLAISAVGCGASKSENNSKSSSQTALEKIKANGKLVVGTSADYPPYEFHAKVNGEDKIVGFDMDIAKQFADDLGVELEIKDMDFDGLLVALQSDKVDMVFAGMTPTEERKQNVDFSDIYYEATHRFILRSGDETAVKSFDDLQGKKIGVQKGSIQEGLAQDNFDSANIKSLAKVTDLVLDLKNNKVDALLVEEGVANIFCEKNEGIAVSDFVVKDEDGGCAIALKKDSGELKDEINKTIKKLNDAGKIQEYLNKATELAGEQ